MQYEDDIMSKRDMIINPITGEIDLDLHRIVKGFSTGGQSLKDSLNEVDPWLQNKINNEFPDSEPSPDGSICSDEENSKVVSDEPKPEDCEK